MDSLLDIPDAELRRKLSDHGFNVGPITDTTRVLYRKRLIALQEQPGNETPKKLQGQKRKAKETTSPNGILASIETPTKRPRRGSIMPTGSPSKLTLQTKLVEVTEPKSLGTPSKIPTPVRSTKRGRKRKETVVAMDLHPSDSVATTPTTEHATTTQATPVGEAPTVSFSTADMTQVFLAAAHVLQQNSGSSPPARQDRLTPTSNSQHLASLAETVIKNSQSSSRNVSVEKSVTTQQTRRRQPVTSFLLDQTEEAIRTSSNVAEEPLLRNVFPDAHKFIEEAWYSDNRGRRMKAVLQDLPKPDSPPGHMPEIDAILVDLASTRDVDLEEMDHSLYVAQASLQNAARPIYKLIHECLNGVIKKKLVKDCINDSLAFVSHAYETLGTERRRLRRQL